jgi:regulator of replication initiation timing
VRAVSEELERLQREVAQLHAELDDLKIKIAVCYELLARLREDVEHLKRRSRRVSLREYIETLKVYNEVETGGMEPP